MFQRKVSITVFVIVTLVVITTLSLGILGFITYKLDSTRQWAKIHTKLAIMADQLSHGLEGRLWNFDEEHIVQIIESNMKDVDIYGLIIKPVSVNSEIYACKRDENWNIIITNE